MAHNHSRVRNLGLAGVLALLAAILTLIYVSHGQGGGAKAAMIPSTDVLVAAHDLSVGTSVSSALSTHAIVLRSVATSALEPGSLTSPGAVRGDVVLQPIFRGEQVLSERLGPTSAAGIRSVVGGSMRVLQIAGDAQQLLAGTLETGDHVDVVASLKTDSDATPKAKTILQNVLVLEAPTSGGSSSDGSSDFSATVAVTDGQAQTLFNALNNGNWTFVLRPASRSNPAR